MGLGGSGTTPDNVEGPKCAPEAAGREGVRVVRALGGWTMDGAGGWWYGCFWGTARRIRDSLDTCVCKGGQRLGVEGLEGSH